MVWRLALIMVVLVVGCGSFLITPAGDCSLLFLVADSEGRVRTAASVIGRR